MAEFRSRNNDRRGGRSGGGGFRRNNNGRSFGNRGRSDRRELVQHDATCSKCGKECKVPFKPTSDKPVYCSDCYENVEKKDSSRGNRNFSRGNNSSEDFKKLNEKLDKIIDLLSNSEKN